MQFLVLVLYENAKSIILICNTHRNAQSILSFLHCKGRFQYLTHSSQSKGQIWPEWLSDHVLNFFSQDNPQEIYSQPFLKKPQNKCWFRHKIVKNNSYSFEVIQDPTLVIVCSVPQVHFRESACRVQLPISPSAVHQVNTGLCCKVRKGLGLRDLEHGENECSQN